MLHRRFASFETHPGFALDAPQDEGIVDGI
jgi:hypothetical protein